MPHTKGLHNNQEVNLSASTKLFWHQKSEQINNSEQSAHMFSKILVNNVQIVSNVCSIYTFVHDRNLSYMCK